MWYVNSLLTICVLSFIVSFILTMWYVNIDNTTVLETDFVCFILTMWYVNDNDGNGDFNVDYSFILTMWYVNLISHILLCLFGYKFYINYVICNYLVQP